jgi:hypothetical protein
MKTHTATAIPTRYSCEAAGRSPGLAVLAAATFALLLCAPAAADAATRWVNDNAVTYLPPGTNCTRPGYPTIQAAVNAAGAGDVIRVCPGKYVENVTIATSNLTVFGTAGAAATMVKAAKSAYVFVIAASGVTLRGFTIIAAGVADGDIGVNVAIDGATGLKLLDNVIFSGRIGVNLGCVTSGSVVAYNTVHGQTEAGVNIDTCEAPPFPGSRDNTIHHNVACSFTATASIALGGSSDDNRIQYNVATKISVFGSGNVVRYNTTQTAIVDNGSGSTLNNNLTDPGVCPPLSGGGS